jgi:hypothetical protein
MYQIELAVLAKADVRIAALPLRINADFVIL